MDENDIPPALRETFRQIQADFTLNLESDAQEIAVNRGMIKEYVGALPIVDRGTKREIMMVLLTDPNYLQPALESLLKSCQGRGMNPIDCQVFMDVIRALAVDGKIKIPF